jgi:hypothetical protein
MARSAKAFVFSHQQILSSLKIQENKSQSRQKYIKNRLQFILELLYFMRIVTIHKQSKPSFGK